MNYVYSLSDALQRRIPVTSIEYNPPVVSCLEKQDLAYWQGLNEPDEEDLKILKSLKAKIKSMGTCRQIGSFMSITDSAAGRLRMHNLTLLQLLSDARFVQRWFDSLPVTWDESHVIIHLTRNHSICWLRGFLESCRKLGFTQLLLITGDPLKEVRFRTVTAEQAFLLKGEEAKQFRLKNSIEMLKFVSAEAPEFFIGACHNPFLKKEAAHKHLMNKVNAGAQFIITQPVSYYDECWRVMGEFESFFKHQQLQIPIILGVFNYAVPQGKQGYRPDLFEKRYKLWKRLFGFVPSGVRKDYELGLNGIEILAKSINKLKRMGYYHFDVMNAERNGWTVLKKGMRFTHELDRLSGARD